MANWGRRHNHLVNVAIQPNECNDLPDDFYNGRFRWRKHHGNRERHFGELRNFNVYEYSFWNARCI